MEVSLKSQNVKLAKIFADPEFNCRGLISQESVKDLAQSVRLKGLYSPIILQPYTDPRHPEAEYRVVAGHRRFEAFKLNAEKHGGVDYIPAFVRDDITTELQAHELNLAENLQRKDLDMLQEARALQYFLKFKSAQGRPAFTDKELGVMFGKGTAWVTTRRQLLSLPKEIQAEAAMGTINGTHIRQLIELAPIDQYTLVKQIKAAKDKNEKIDLKKHDAHDLMKARPRTKPEIMNMNSKLYDLFGPGFIARYGAWCAGEISTVLLEMELEKHCIENGVDYKAPPEIAGAIRGEDVQKTLLRPT